VHRNALFGAQYTTDWTNGAGSTGINNQHTWLRKYWGSMRPYASGQAYQNYIDRNLTNWQQATTSGGNYGRLVAIKKKYDRPACSPSPRPSGRARPRAWRSPAKA